MLPTVQGTCPTLTSGSAQMVTINGTSMPWTLYVGAKASSATGPIVFYWHGTGTSSAEVTEAIGQAAVNEVQSMGGVVASAESTSGTGAYNGDGVWYEGDFSYADQILACAIQQLNIDTSHIHTGGYSAGAIISATMYYKRSGYLASVVLYSGGTIAGQLQDPSNVAPVLGAHGSTTGDFLASATTSFEQSVKMAGAPIVIDCDDGGSHVDITRLINLGPSAWQFFKDHPFKQGKPDPYANGLPSGFLSICKIQ